MGTTLTIRNLDEEVKRKLRIRAAEHQISMEAEVCAILASSLEESDHRSSPRTPEELREHLSRVRGLWKGKGSTDELMQFTRGGD